MEKQNKNFERKEGEPRISTRPGNFIVPGERVGEGNAAKAGDKSRNRRRGRRGHGHGHGQNPGSKQSETQNKEKNTPPKDKKAEGEHKGGHPPKNRRDRRHGHRPRDVEKKRSASPEISATMQHELDTAFAAPLEPTSFLAPFSHGEKSAPESPAVDTKEFEVDIATAAYLLDDVPCGFPVPDGKAVEVIGVRFRGAGKIYFFAPGGERFKIGEAAIVDTARGAEFGEVVMLNRKMAEKDIVQPLRSVLRRATEEDIRHYKENREKEAEALKTCAEKIAARGLEMNLVDAQYTFDNSKLLFYFTAEGRVDFRELVRDLASLFRTRIELRQIGIRDEARLIGGLGMCGRPFCCATYLSDFGQVSVKMAKEQGLSINTPKISGCCGRLMCCLRYEHESYAQEAKLTPKKDTRVTTPDGVGTVVDTTPITGMVKVRLDSDPDAAPTPYHRDKLTVLGADSAKKEPAADATEGEKADA